jgi:hypothetical protein
MSTKTPSTSTGPPGWEGNVDEEMAVDPEGKKLFPPLLNDLF